MGVHERGRESSPREALRRPSRPSRSATSAVHELQRTVGNRATARLVHSRAASRGVQRLIAVNPAGTPATDYAIMKQVHQLRASQNPKHNIVMLNQGTDFRGMAAGEDLFIVSHGDSATGEMRNINTNSLIGWLNGAKGVPAHFGKIVVLSCYGGMAKPDTALAERIASGLKHKGHDVEGATGFSFGTPEFSQSGHSSVLSEDLRVFYTADSIDDMAAAWAERNPTHAGGVLAGVVSYVDQFATIKENYVRAKGAKGADGWIRQKITYFRDRAKAIEQGLGTAIGQTQGASVQEKITSLEAPPPPGGAVPAHVTSWNTLLAEQYQLFHDYYLWTDPAQAFATFTS
ncbi:MAG TPA: hypothetical protein VH418_01610 [Solirubrobacteraceae bacterium]|jgi:hypothetical protein